MQPSNTELILIRVTGEDRPGLTASVTEILAKYDATILDIGQADIHNTCLLYTSPSPRDRQKSRMPSSA